MNFTTTLFKEYLCDILLNRQRGQSNRTFATFCDVHESSMLVRYVASINIYLDAIDFQISQIVSTPSIYGTQSGRFYTSAVYRRKKIEYSVPRRI